MGVSPIETISLPPKSQEASIFRGNETRAPVHEQINLQQRMEQQTLNSGQQIVSKKEIENARYRYDAKEEGGNKQGYNPRKKKQSKKTEDEKQAGQELRMKGFDGSTIDIRI